MGKKSTENRRIVLDMLMELETDSKAKEHILLSNVLNKYDYMDRQDKAFITYLFEGVVRNRIKLDYVIKSYAKTKNGKIKPVVLNVLRMTVFQILYMDSVPGSAACNEAVNLVIDRGLSGLKGFVNAVSRNIERNKDSIEWPDKTKEFEKYLSVYYSMPEWIVAYLLKLYGPEKTTVMFSKMTESAKVTIRVTDDASIETVLNALKDNGHNPVKHQYLSDAFIISKLDGAGNLPGFDEGMFTIQDASSQLAVKLAGIKPGDKVLDLCSAPGGKAVYAAKLTGSTGYVDARDIADYKLDYIKDNADRLNLKNISVKQWDASEYDESIEHAFDVVIVDAPCSGMGVMGRKSDIKYNLSYNTVKELAALQKKILLNAVKYLKKGGTLMYLTCTVTKEENLDNRNWLLDNTELTPVSFEEMLPPELKNQGGSEGYLQLLPGIHQCDGFFISKYM